MAACWCWSSPLRRAASSVLSPARAAASRAGDGRWRMGEPLLAVSNLTRRFGGLLAVNSVSIAADEGRITGLIGPNGAGKTTLFGLISGFVAPNEGEIRYAGETITRLPTHERARRGIARTFQIVQPFAGLTVREN